MRTWLHFMDWPLRAKMAALLVVASILPLGVETFINIREARARLVANTADLLAARGDHLADQLDIFHRSYQRAVDRLAHLPSVLEFCQARQQDSDRFKSSVRSLLEVWPASDTNIRGIAILDLSGTVKVGTEDPLIGINLSYHSYVQEALRGVAVTSNIHLAEPQVGASPTIAYLAPVLGSDRKLVGIAVLWIRATSLWDVMKASNELAGPGSFAVLFDHQGIRIAHTFNEDIVFHPGGRLDPGTINALVAERRFGEKTRALLEDVRAFPEQFDRALAKSPDEAVFRGFAPVNQKWNYGVARRFETVPWTVFYMIPEESLNARIALMTRQKTVFALVIIFAALTAGTLFAAFILKPIGSLSTATKLIAGGDLAARVQPGHADEFGRLGTSFNSMAERIEAQAAALQGAHDELELRIQERTAKLVLTTKNLEAEIAERKRAERGAARLAAIVESSSDAIVGKDLHSNVTTWNAGAERMFGYAASEMVGQSITRIIPTDLQDDEEKILARVTRGEGVEHFETQRLRKDGKLIDVSVTVSPIKDAEGQVVGASKVARDITERKRAEESLRDTQARLNSTLAAGSIGTWTWDIVNDCLAADEFTARMFSIEAEAAAKGLPAEVYLQVIYEEDRPDVEDALARAIQSCGHYDIEYRVRQKDGGFRWLQARGRVEGDEAGNALNFHGAVMDITERKQAEEALRESEGRLRLSQQVARIGTFDWNIQTGVNEWTPELEAMYGLPPGDFAGTQQTWEELIYSEDRAEAVRQVSLAMEGKDFEAEWRVIWPDGTVHWLAGRALVFKDESGNPLRLLGVNIDITERKRAEAKIRALNAELEQRVEERTAALHASEARYRLLFDSIDEGFCIIEMIFDEQEKPVDYRFLEVNPSFERQTGLRDAVGKRMRELAPRHEEHWFETYGHIAVTGETARFQNHAKELHRWYDVYACRFGESKNRQVAIVFGDVTERKAAEANIAQLNAELQQRAAELNSLFESLPGLYLVLTPDLKIVSASDAYLKATMTTREGIVGRDLFEIFPDNPNDPDTTAVSNMRASIDRVIHNAVPDTMAIQKHDIRRPDGEFEEHFWSPINSPMFGADRQIKYIVHRVEEVTEFVRQKSQPSDSPVELSARVQQMEAEVFQSSQNLQAANQQLEAANKELESFSYSVSHDLRAPLRHINGFSQALLEDYEDKLDDAGKNYLNEVRGASQQMAQLIDDILQLARVTRSEMRREVVNLSDLAQSVVAEHQKRDPGRPVAVQIEERLLTHGDRRLLEILLSNLLGNAWKFTSKREQPEISFSQELKDDEAVYVVRDNGAGFDMSYADKLFGAFQRLHTTQDFEGTGIGLATVQRVINRHGGRVWAEGTVNEGATFYFTLPDIKGERT